MSLTNADGNGALKGIRVLDLTSNISGPSATVILADMGAEVIKVERPGKGDDARGMGPFVGGESAYFLAINRNKQSLVVDIRTQKGQDIIKRIAGKVDICVENFRRGVLDKYQLDGPSLCKINPRLIYCSLSAYGDDGHESRKPGYDAVLQARTGIMSITGSRASEPARAGVSILDMGSGMWSVIAILSALFHREQTGRGQIVGTSLLETGVYWMNYHLTAYQFNQRDPGPLGTSHAAFAPYGAYKTADDLMLLGVSNDSQFQRLLSAIKCEEWAKDQRFERNKDRLTNRVLLDHMLNEKFSKQPCDYWLQKLEEAGIPCSKIQKVSQVFQDPQVMLLNSLQTVSTNSMRTVEIPRLPIRMQKSPTTIKSSAPALGQHTCQILKKFGFVESEIRTLLKENIIEK